MAPISLFNVDHKFSGEMATILLKSFPMGYSSDFLTAIAAL
jgi:hypothetical protein